MIAFACPKCHKLGEVPDEALGKTAPCPNCGEIVSVTLDVLFSQPEPGVSSPDAMSGYGASAVPPQRFRPPQTNIPPVGRGFGPAALLPAAGALVLSAIFYVVLIALQRSAGHDLVFAEKFLARGWTPYVCVLLTFWSLTFLIRRWLRAVKRERCLAASSIPQSASLKTEMGSQQLLGPIQEVARKYGDDMLAKRIQRLVTHYRTSRNPEAVAEALNAEGDADFNELDLDLSLVRSFLWAIPILGFAGTVIGIGKGVGGFGAFLSVGAQELDDIKAALIKVTSGLAVAFDTTLVALLLSVIVMMCLSYVESKEKRLLQAIDNFCRQQLMPHMFAAKAQAAAASDDVATRAAEVLRSAIADLRDTLANFARNAGTEWAEQFAQSRVEAGRQWAGELDRLRQEMTEAYKHYAELGKEHLAQGQAMNNELSQRLNEVQQLVGTLRESLEALIKAGLQSPGQWQSREPAALLHETRTLVDAATRSQSLAAELDGPVPPSRIDGLGAALGDLHDGVRSMDKFLRRLAERLDRLANQPQEVKLNVVVRAREGGVN